MKKKPPQNDPFNLFELKEECSALSRIALGFIGLRKDRRQETTKSLLNLFTIPRSFPKFHTTKKMGLYLLQQLY